MSPALLRIWRAPAVTALLLQGACLPLTYALVWLLLRAGADIDYAGAALIQGVLASAASLWRRLAAWWLAIQLLFPLALLGGLGLQLPSWLFLALFLIFLLVFWSTFRTQVPYYPSGQRAWNAVAALLPARPLNFIDVGSGLGGLVLELAARRPDSTFCGIELAPLPWLLSRWRAQGRPNAHFVRGDYETLDFAAFDVVFAYLSPAVMTALFKKASAEMRPGSLLLSYEFCIATKTPDLTIQPDGGGALLYGWHF
ncbi:MAG: SAM-dependent methyltransferase [Massilia sp.]|nr:SAM-dependent methyltransferase [Massilia sp.]